MQERTCIPGEKQALVAGYLMGVLDIIESRCMTMLEIGGLPEGNARSLASILEDCNKAREFSKYAEENFDRGPVGISDFIQEFREHYDSTKAQERRAGRIAQVVEVETSGEQQ